MAEPPQPSGRRRWTGPLGTLALVVGGGTLVYLAYTGRLRPSTVSLIATLALVGLTAAYARATRRLVEETRHGRQQEIKPLLEFRPKEYRSELVNIGRGPARDIDVTLTLEPADESHHIHWQSLAPGASLAIPTEPFSSIADREFVDLQYQGVDVDWDAVPEGTDVFEDREEYPYERLVLTGSCRDVWGARHPVEATYDVWQLTESMRGSAPSGMPTETALELIATEVSGIRALMEHDDGTQPADRRN